MDFQEKDDKLFDVFLSDLKSHSQKCHTFHI